MIGALPHHRRGRVHRVAPGRATRRRRARSVIVLDDLSTGRRENLAGLLGRPGVQFVRDSVENEATVNTLMAQCDGVFHLASAVGVQLVARRAGPHDPHDDPRHRGRPRRRQPLRPAGADHQLVGGVRQGRGCRSTRTTTSSWARRSTSRWCYAYCKGIDEFLGLAYHKQFGLPVTIVRLFNTVGPAAGRAVRDGAAALRRGGADGTSRCQVYGDGKQTRCFCHVGDVVDALVDARGHAARRWGRCSTSAATRRCRSTTWPRRVIALAGSRSRIEHVSLRAGVRAAVRRHAPAGAGPATRSARRSASARGCELDEIIRSVIDHLRSEPAGSKAD